MVAILLMVQGVTVTSALAQQVEAEVTANDIGFVQLSKIFNESEFVEQWRQEVNLEFTVREKDLQTKVAKFKNLNENEANAQTVAGVQSLAELEREIKRDDRDLAEDKRVRFEEANREVEKIVLETIQTVASQRNILIVFELSSVLFAEKRLDLTADVIATLDVRGVVVDKIQ